MIKQLTNNLIFKFLFTSVIGLVGSILFKFLNVPSPWLTGPMLFAVILGFTKLPFYCERKLNNPTLYLMGVLIGAEFSKDKMSQVIHYPITISVLFISVFTIYIVQYIYYRKVVKWSKFDSLYSSAPGNLAIVLALATQNKADVEKVTLIQSSRLFLISFCIPITLKFIFHIHNTHEVVSTHLDLWGHSLIFVIPIVVCIPLVYIFQKIHAPLPALIAPMVGTMILSASNVIGKIDPPLVITIFVYLYYGIAIGASLSNVSLKKTLQLTKISIFAFTLILINDFIFSYMASSFLKLDLILLMISFLPGGIQAMSLVCMGLGLDSIFCTVHHLIRVNVFAFITPALSTKISKNPND